MAVDAPGEVVRVPRKWAAKSAAAGVSNDPTRTHTAGQDVRGRSHGHAIDVNGIELQDGAQIFQQPWPDAGDGGKPEAGWEWRAHGTFEVIPLRSGDNGLREPVPE